MPRFVEPQAPTLVHKIPTGSEWVHEIKHDGYRILAFIDGGKVRLVSRRNFDWTGRLAPIARALQPLATRQAIIDGEVCAPDENGVTRVTDMRGAIRGHPERLVYFVFDLLWLDGLEVRKQFLLERKRLLHRLVRPVVRSQRIIYSDHIEGEHGPELYRRLTELGCEGIVSKRADAPYRSGDGGTWRKIKPEEVRQRQAEAARAPFAREPVPEAAADLERLGLKSRLFPTAREKAMPAKRQLIAPKGDKRYARRGKGGQFKEVDAVGRSLSSDRKRKAKTVAKRGQGDKGDRRRR